MSAVVLNSAPDERRAEIERRVAAARAKQARADANREHTSALLATYRTAAAAYTQTDHDGLIQGQVDHTLMIGHRVVADRAEFAEMAQRLEGGDPMGFDHLDKCPACSRAVDHGDFGVDHIMYYREGDAEKKPAKVRSIPRIWCTPCAQARAKSMRRPYVKSREVARWRDEWEQFVRGVEAEQHAARHAGDVIVHLDSLAPPEVIDPAAPRIATAPPRDAADGDGAAAEADDAANAEAAKPKNKPTRLAWKWINHQLAGAPRKHVEGKFEFVVTAARTRGEVDVDARTFALEVDVEYAARTTLVSGEAVRACGRCVVACSSANGEPATVEREVRDAGTCVLATPPPPETPTAVAEGMLRKTDMATKLWLKKGVPACVWGPLEGVGEKVVSLLPDAAK